MITSFADDDSRDIFDGANTRGARNALPRDLWKVARRKLTMLAAAQDIRDLTAAPGNRVEWMEGPKRWSLRINDQYRVTFDWEPGRASNVRVEDYHS